MGLASPRQPIRAILSVEQSNGNSVKDSDASLSVRLALQVCLGSRSQFPCGVLSCLGAFPAREVLLSLSRWQIPGIESGNTPAQTPPCASHSVTPSPFPTSRAELSDGSLAQSITETATNGQRFLTPGLWTFFYLI